MSSFLVAILNVIVNLKRVKIAFIKKIYIYLILKNLLVRNLFKRKISDI